MHREMASTAENPTASSDPTGRPAWDDHERAALVALLRARYGGLTWSEIAAEVADARSASSVWDQHHSPDLFTDGTPSPMWLAALAEVGHWKNDDFQFLTFMDDGYPQQLLEVHQFPPVLFVKGTLVSREVGVSVVGSRSASQQALHSTREIAELLTKDGITVISGLAAGVDTVAHLATLEAGGRTVAVIGTGIRQYYPSQNRELQDAISHRGLVISQFWPDSPPSKSSFPMRNATMSAYGSATVVVEAGEHSGARIQARLAVAHGRPVVLMDSVVKGTSWGAKLHGQPGVMVADGPMEVIRHVNKIVSNEGKVSALLGVMS
jgi:DNA protecting protein DprA